MVKIYDTFKTVKEIARHIKSKNELGAMDNYYQTTLGDNIFVNCVKVGNDKYINDFNYTDTIWYEKTFGDFNDDNKNKASEVDLVFRLDDIKLPGKHEKKYRYLGAFQLVSVTKDKGMTVREWHYIDNYDKIEE